MKSSGIGGQAVLEGVMMKNKEKYAIAVRKPDNEIAVEVSEYRGISDKFSLFKLPILRGVAAFADSMFIGTKALTFSSEFFEEEEEKDKKEKKASDGIFTFLTFFFSIAFAVGIFILLPLFISNLISKKLDNFIILGIIEGIIRVALFVGYVLAISQMKDIKRFFQYHGAEHKTINCIERGYELTVSNVRKQTKEHKRCGTSFMLFVMLVSIILFMFIQVDQIWLRYVLRILLIPVVAGISYEIIRAAGKSDNIFIRVISAPGMWMQRLTTKEPDDSMIEVAIASVEAVFDWQAYLAENFKKSGKKNKKKSGKNARNQVTARRDETAATQEEDLSSLDKTLFEEEQVAEQKHDQLVERAKFNQGENRVRSTEIATSLEPDELDEEDEILKALDRYLTSEKEEK